MTPTIFCRGDEGILISICDLNIQFGMVIRDLGTQDKGKNWIMGFILLAVIYYWK
jgi:hypothetical protein